MCPRLRTALDPQAATPRLTKAADGPDPDYKTTTIVRGLLLLAALFYVQLAVLVLLYDPRDFLLLLGLFIYRYALVTTAIHIFWAFNASLIQRLGLPGFTESFALFILFLSTLSETLYHDFGAEYEPLISGESDAVLTLFSGVFTIPHLVLASILLRLAVYLKEKLDCASRILPLHTHHYLHPYIREIWHVILPVMSLVLCGISLAIVHVSDIIFYNSRKIPLSPFPAHAAVVFGIQAMWLAIEVVFERGCFLETWQRFGRGLFVVALVGLILGFCYKMNFSGPWWLWYLFADLQTFLSIIHFSWGMWIMIWPLISRIFKRKFHIEA
jgi:hypothetical protein